MSFQTVECLPHLHLILHLFSSVVPTSYIYQKKVGLNPSSL